MRFTKRKLSPSTGATSANARSARCSGVRGSSSAPSPSSVDGRRRRASPRARSRGRAPRRSSRSRARGWPTSRAHGRGRSCAQLLVPPGLDPVDHVADRPLEPRERHAPDVDPGEEREGVDAHERRARARRRVGPALALMAEERRARAGRPRCPRARRRRSRPSRRSAITVTTSDSSVASRRSRSTFPHPVRHTTRRPMRSRPSRSVEPKSEKTNLVGLRRDGGSGATATGRSRVSASSSSRVVASYAVSIRSVNSSSVNRPSATCSRSTATVWSRSSDVGRHARVRREPIAHREHLRRGSTRRSAGRRSSAPPARRRRPCP